MEFIAVSYCYPDLDGDFLSREALEQLASHNNIPLTFDFRRLIGVCVESKTLGDSIITHGVIDPDGVAIVESDKDIGVAMGFMFTQDRKEYILNEISLTPKPSCPNTKVVLLRNA
jgi:hypothetical protein